MPRVEAALAADFVDPPTAPRAEKIRLSRVGKHFVTRERDVEALQPIDLTIHAHEFVALVGPSGCGKSTILNLIAGLLQPSGGVACRTTARW